MLRMCVCVFYVYICKCMISMCLRVCVCVCACCVCVYPCDIYVRSDFACVCVCVWMQANATATVEALLARFVRGPPASIDALDAEGCTCLHLACVHGSTGSAAALVRHGAAVNAASEQADTPLHYATWVWVFPSVHV